MRILWAGTTALLTLLTAVSSAEKHAAVTLIESRCAGCHNSAVRQSGLDVTSRGMLLRGGDRGPAVEPGKPAGSLLYRAVAHLAEPHMPHKMPKLSGAEVQLIESWIASGAPMSDRIAVTPAPKREHPATKHWAYQKPLRPPVPRAADGWAANPVDAFIAAQHKQNGLVPVPEADPRTLLRRLYLDVVGVPPTREELAGFLNDAKPGAWTRAVDRVLADARYGERWGRHWMDVWRYSDWYGYRRSNEVRNSAKHIWRWRDWIVESLNQDKGYDRMIAEMLAGDEIAPEDPQVLRATGYLARSYSRYDRHGWMQDAVDHTAMGFLGITLKCARCHDHKYDPLSQEEYFRFRAFFEPYQVRTDRVPGQLDVEKDGLARIYEEDPKAKTHLLIRGDVQNPDKDNPLDAALPSVFGKPLLRVNPVSLPVSSYYPDAREFVHADMLAKARADIESAEKELKDAKDDSASRLAAKALAAARAHLPALEARIAADRARFVAGASGPETDALIAAARKAERAAGVLKADENLLRAQMELSAALTAQPANEKRVSEAKRKLTEAADALNLPAEGYTAIGKTYPERSSGRRLALAQWIGSRDNPLTARVAVNHIWLRHFGKALVPTVADFGVNGKPPSHPQLLDWLALELVDNGWSMKHLHRMILTSRTYRMQSTSGDEGQSNAKIDPDNRYLWKMNPRRMEAEAVRDSILHVAGALDPAQGGPPVEGGKAMESRRRSIYIEHTPDVPVLFLKAFDSASPAECYERTESVVPHQALALTNSQLSRDQAAQLAKRLADEGQRPEQFAALAFETILGRPAKPAEMSAAAKFLRSPLDQADLVHVLLNHNDFVTIR